VSNIQAEDPEDHDLGCCFAHRAFCASEMRLRASADIVRFRRPVEGEEVPSAPATLLTAAAALPGSFPSHALNCVARSSSRWSSTSMPRGVK
jgi:hypothetical protein